MRNLLKEGPADQLHGIPLRTASLAEGDLYQRDVLDIGCGFGWFEVFAISRGAQTVTGVEVSDRDLETARKHLDAPNVRLEVGSAIDLRFDDESFDTVVCWEVLEHIEKGTELDAFREIRRVLRPGGVLYLSTPHASLLSNALDPAWWLIGHRHYSMRTLRRLADRAGLSVELLEVRGGLWLISSILNLYVAKWIFRRGPFLEQLVNRRVDAELAETNGFAGCFMKCRASARDGAV